MSDLEGMDAFTAVLDRMVDAELKVARLENERDEARSDARRAQPFEKNLMEVKRELDQAIAKGSALWEAAYAAVTKPDVAEIAKLKEAVEAARGPFDGIPF